MPPYYEVDHLTFANVLGTKTKFLRGHFHSKIKEKFNLRETPIQSNRSLLNRIKEEPKFMFENWTMEMLTPLRHTQIGNR